MNPPPIPEKLVFVVAEKDLPPAAPLRFRVLAFLADGVLALIVAALAVKILVPVFYPEGFSLFAEYYRDFRTAYEAALNAAVSGNVDRTAIDAVSARALQDERLYSFFETVYSVSFIAVALYFVLTEFFLRGQSLGKKIFGLRTVVFGTPFPPLFLQILSRSFWKAITLVPVGPLLALLGLANAVVVLFARRHRGWHDKLARTEVIDLRELEKRSSKK